MKKENKNVPALRFKGFEEEWEEKKFSEQADTRRGLTYSPSSVSKEGVRVLRSSNIDDDKFVTSPDDVFVLADAINIEYAKENDILITSANGSSRLVGKHCVLTGISKQAVVHGGFMLLASAKCPFFLNASMSSEWYKKFISYHVAGGQGAIGNLNKSDLDEELIYVPKDSEQQKIGSFFKELDELISAKEEELEKLRQLKAALLDAMFPSDDTTSVNRGGHMLNSVLNKYSQLEVYPDTPNTPRVRFKGYKKAWEREQLSACFFFDIPHNSLSRDKLTSEIREFQNVHYGDILINYTAILDCAVHDIPFIGDADYSTPQMALLHERDIVFADTAEDATAGKAVEISNVQSKKIVAGLHTIVARPKKNFASFFLGYYFNSDFFHSQIVPLLQGTKVLSINKAVLSDTVIAYPLEKQEQQQIGNFFRSQDEGITAVEEQIMKLKMVKQACLQQMFV